MHGLTVISLPARRAIVPLLIAAVVSGCVGGQSDANPPSADDRSPTQASPAQPPARAFAAIDGARLLLPAVVEARPAADGQAAKELARANAEFAIDVYRALAAGSDGNLIVGPHSISSSLAMVYAGARGETASEMAGVLHFDGLPGDPAPAFNALDHALRSRSEEADVELQLANQAFAQPEMSWLDSYLSTLASDFGAPMAELDFSDPEAAREIINRWAAGRTNERIKELFPSGTLTPQTRLVLVNAVSMDAQWRYRFDPAQTSDEQFRLADGEVITVPTMHFDLYMPLVSTEAYAAVELPYGAGDLSMVVILPDDLAEFEEQLDPHGLQVIFDAIREEGIHLSLPKFSFKAHTPLDETLKALGMAGAYGGSADFSGMTGSRDLFLQTVQHEAFIEVDEEGTEAHAATGSAMAASHGPTITLDRPFFFVIRDRPTGTLLFVGRVMDPRGE